MQWFDDPAEHLRRLHQGVATCANAGADVVFLPELTLSRYPADMRPKTAADRHPEDINRGPSVAFAREAAQINDVFVQVSLYELASNGV